MRAIVRIKPVRPLPIETFKDFPEIGRFALRDMGTTIGAGVVLAITEKYDPKQKVKWTIDMPQAARIKLTSTNLTTLEGVCNEIKGIGEKTGIRLRGPHPLPTKKLKVVTRKSPAGQGTNTWDKYEMRIHRRVIDVGADDRAIRQLMRLKIPDDVYIEVSLTQ